MFLVYIVYAFSLSPASSGVGETRGFVPATIACMCECIFLITSLDQQTDFQETFISHHRSKTFKIPDFEILHRQH